MGEKYQTLSELNLEGQFLGFVGDKSGQYKHLRLAIPSGKVKVKLPKDLRCSPISTLVPGEQIRIGAIGKLNSRTSKIKLKAYQVEAVGLCLIENRLPQTKAKIMVCQKSGCMKRGGKSLLSELEKTLCDRGLSDQVTIEHTDCQKRCSSAPNCVLMLGKKQYKKVHPEAIASLLENHLKGCFKSE
ncbi:(2Fe-2S) ferredoxin domain-containing protein [Anabaena cylindrica FACHB-243]|uniref:Nucleic acid-binding OB-fold tRNA/helicase-type protein n=1 Tax=Anabaena cylindrica (strain ATCC 27899 / PCC 7122) TaxID=272123 RepID=K9Z9F3_ANACC|nr:MULTISPECIES: (2Fe-2S) ferredoxin domain-containing protein [Anabaena]AFZ55828.1 nucleic acid-binding OB-fold tRNA/helicase-type protein [Anabaena cylindrica PCC 7122]MBD2421249.1 (2Fe-2S) ferredoxin domain-containing protein [Anabaena cylindrica FACHB-243]MBY5284136.1 (2Fe-2S) ferredoxin domain-containing protein [Anabaena sp. CCAP 1446/1C]MBY5308080.1 (2Fe-2S) ferredoxin domain-containing protein [Anabaena sp. CCAP 1446/1C]MCM2406580.1 (2Fe-2S) ferredoxin domain-containing protein [Anabae